MAQQGDELIQAQAELRDFRRTVLALRQELENAHAEAEARLRKSAADAKAEAAQLESTVIALREELEEARAAVRVARDEAWKDIQEKERAGKITEDDKFTSKEELQKRVDKINGELEKAFENKEKEMGT